MKVKDIANCCETMRDNGKDCNECPCAVECGNLLPVLRSCEPWDIKNIIEEDY